MKDFNNHFQRFPVDYFEDIENIPMHENYFTPILIKLRSLINNQNARILDVGCGTGLFTSPLALWGFSNLYGVDGSREIVDLAISRGFKEVNIISDLSSSCLPYDSDFFDVIICKDVLEHLIDPLYAVREITRVLRSDGILLVHVPNHFPLVGRFKFLFENDLDTFKFFPNSTRFNFPHIRFFEFYEFCKLFNESGYEIIFDLSYFFPVVPILNRFSLLKPIVSTIVRRWPNQFAGGFTMILKNIRV